VVEQGTWRIKTNRELWKLYIDLDIAADIKKRRLEWIGNLVRMDHGRVVKKIFREETERKKKGKT
jgi:hypothetical protein